MLRPLDQNFMGVEPSSTVFITLKMTWKCSETLPNDERMWHLLHHFWNVSKWLRSFCGFYSTDDDNSTVQNSELRTRHCTAVLYNRTYARSVFSVSKPRHIVAKPCVIFIDVSIWIVLTYVAVFVRLCLYSKQKWALRIPPSPWRCRVVNKW